MHACLARKMSKYLVEGTTNHDDEVSGDMSKNVSTRDNARASKLKGGLGTNNNIKGITGERKVNVSVALSAVEMVGRDEDGGITALHHAIMEEEAESAGCGGGIGQLLLCDNLPDSLLKVRACFSIVVKREL